MTRLWTLLLLLLLAAPAGAVTCTVTSTADSGAGSFRQAVADANAASCDRIEFAIAGAGVHTIALGSQLLVTAANVTIDGSTQSGSSRGDLWGGTPPVWNIAVTGHPITFDTTATGGVLIGVDVSATAATEPAVQAAASGMSIKACYLHGAANMGLRVSADSVTVGGVNAGDGNVISGNTNEGVVILVSTGVVVQGNFICTDKTGMTAEPNTIGVSLEGAASATIGGLGSAKNLISGCSASNAQAGNGVGGDAAVWAHDGVVQYNLIGTDKTGLAPIASATPVGGVSFVLQNAQPTPGPATPGIDNFNIHHNTVSANNTGVTIGTASFTSANNTIVAFNNIGTDVNGAQAVGLCNLTADLLNFGTASDIHDNNLCAFTPTPTPTNTPEPHCAPVVCNTPDACDSATCFGTNNPDLPFVPSDYASPSALQTAVDGILGPGAITVGAYTNGAYCTTSDLIGECPTPMSSPTPTPTPTGVSCDIGAVTLEYTGPTETIAAPGITFTGVPAAITHAYSAATLQSGDIFTSPAEGGFSLSAPAHAASRIGNMLTVNIFTGIDVITEIFTSRVSPAHCIWQVGSPAPLDISSLDNIPPVACRPSTLWRVAAFACESPLPTPTTGPTPPCYPQSWQEWMGFPKPTPPSSAFHEWGKL